jgi:hypothetical protein
MIFPAAVTLTPTRMAAESFGACPVLASTARVPIDDPTLNDAPLRLSACELQLRVI